VRFGVGMEEEREDGGGDRGVAEEREDMEEKWESRRRRDRRIGEKSENRSKGSRR